jgi:tryptophan-rich sensory protein
MAENEYENEISNVRNNNGNSGLEDVTDFIYRHKIAVIGVLSLIPILAFTIVGFKNNHYILGCISISFLITLFILLYAIGYKTGKTSHLFLLVFLLALQFGLIVFFLTP